MLPQRKFVYVLRDPRDGHVRYVGVTINFIQRMSDHLSKGRNRQEQLYAWLSDLASQGMLPISSCVETIEADGDWGAAERKWITYYKLQGEPLLNLTIGGGGRPQKTKHVDKSKAVQIRKIQPDHYAAMQSGLQRWLATPEGLASRAASRKLGAEKRWGRGT